MEQLKEILSDNNISTYDNKFNLFDYYANIDTSITVGHKKYISKRRRQLTTNENSEDNYKGFISYINFAKIISNVKSQKSKEFYEEHKEIFEQILEDNTPTDTTTIADNVDETFIYMGKEINILNQDDTIWFNLNDISEITNTKLLIKNFDEDHLLDDNDIQYINHLGLESIEPTKKSNIDAITWLKNSVIPLFSEDWRDTEECVKDLKLKDYKDKYCVYLLKIRHNTYKYGDSYIIRNRMDTHREKTNLGSFEYVKIYTFDDFRDMKNMALSVKKYTKEQNIDYRDKCDRVELFKTDKINDVLDDIDILFKKYKKDRNILPHSKTYYDALINLAKIKDVETSYKIAINPSNYTDEDLNKIIDRCEKTFRENKIKDMKIKKSEYEQTRKIKCPTPTCDALIFPENNLCHKCASIKQRVVKDRPSKIELINMINESSQVAVAKKYNVATSTIRLWLNAKD